MSNLHASTSYQNLKGRSLRCHEAANHSTISPSRIPRYALSVAIIQGNTSASHSLLITESLLATVISHNQANCIRILQDLHELSTFLNPMGKCRDDLPPGASYPDRVYIVERNILTSIAKANNDKSQNSIFTILLHTGLLFIYTNLRQTPVGGQIRKSLSNRLRSCI